MLKIYSTINKLVVYSLALPFDRHFKMADFSTCILFFVFNALMTVRFFYFFPKFIGSDRVNSLDKSTSKITTHAMLICIVTIQWLQIKRLNDIGRLFNSVLSLAVSFVDYGVRRRRNCNDARSILMAVLIAVGNSFRIIDYRFFFEGFEIFTSYFVLHWRYYLSVEVHASAASMLTSLIDKFVIFVIFRTKSPLRDFPTVTILRINDSIYGTFREINEIYNKQFILVCSCFFGQILNNLYYHYLVSKGFLSYSVVGGPQIANLMSCLTFGSTMSLMFYQSSGVTKQVIIN